MPTDVTRLIQEAFQDDARAYGKLLLWCKNYIRSHHGAHLAPDHVDDAVGSAISGLASIETMDRDEQRLRTLLHRYTKRAQRELQRFEGGLDSEQHSDRIQPGSNAVEQTMYDEFQIKVLEATMDAMLIAVEKIQEDRYHDYIVVHYQLPGVALRQALTAYPDFRTERDNRALRRARAQFLGHLEHELLHQLANHKALGKDPELLTTALMWMKRPPPPEPPTTPGQPQKQP